MFFRFTYLNIPSDKKEEFKKLYTDEVVPVVRAQKGNLSVRLLEPTSENGEFISVTEWESADDAGVYESRGTYKSLVDKFKDGLLSPPVLKTYNEVERRVPTENLF
jgi:quinol monooxygenase YgiN